MSLRDRGTNLRSRRRNQGAIVELTPLIDITFQLLIFFLLTATFQEDSSIDVDLARAKNQDKASRDVQAKHGKPVPQAITRTVTAGGIPSYHVSWRVGTAADDGMGTDDGGYEYISIEPQDLVQQRFPELVQKFLESEKERTKQGDGEKNRRRAFLDSLWINVADTSDKDKNEDFGPSPCQKRNKKRKTFFADSKRPCLPPAAQKQSAQEGGDDVHKLLRCVHVRQPFDGAGESSIESPDGASRASEASQDKEDACTSPLNQKRRDGESLPPTPLYCHFGAFLIPVTPIEAMVPGEFPPRRIYIRRT